MDIVISVDNIKCAGCANSIRQRLMKIPRLISVEVDIQGESVLVTAESDIRAQVVEALSALGYPEKGSQNGLQALGSKAASFVSCALGKVSNES